VLVPHAPPLARVCSAAVQAQAASAQNTLSDSQSFWDIAASENA
jgi:hypothetical protein